MPKGILKLCFGQFIGGKEDQQLNTGKGGAIYKEPGPLGKRERVEDKKEKCEKCNTNTSHFNSRE